REGIKSPLPDAVGGGGRRCGHRWGDRAIEERPGESAYHDAAGNLHCGNRDPEEVENVGADQDGCDEQYEAVERDELRSACPLLRREPGGHGEVDGSSGERIDDRQQRRDRDEHDAGEVLDLFQEHVSVEKGKPRVYLELESSE